MYRHTRREINIDSEKKNKQIYIYDTEKFKEFISVKIRTI